MAHILLIEDDHHHRPAGGPGVEIAVADTGPGIPEEEMAHVFDRLYRGHTARTGAPTGAGLGLAIVASLTRAMGGDVAVTSAPGEGTTFTVTLPGPPAEHPIPTRTG
jgi:signal transduction histidine kinase